MTCCGSNGHRVTKLGVEGAIDHTSYCSGCIVECGKGSFFVLENLHFLATPSIIILLKKQGWFGI